MQDAMAVLIMQLDCILASTILGMVVIFLLKKAINRFWKNGR